jgi:hypothetical protein
LLLACAKDEIGAATKHAHAKAILLRRAFLIFDLHQDDTKWDGEKENGVALGSPPQRMNAAPVSKPA